MKKNGLLKRIIALGIVVLWGILLLTTLVVAFIDNEICNTLFRGLMITDILLPVVAYAMMLVYRILSKKELPK